MRLLRKWPNQAAGPTKSVAVTQIGTIAEFTGHPAADGGLHLGLEKMWLRYPAAVGISYSVFFLLLRLWISYQQKEKSLTQDALDLADLDPTDYLPSNGSVSSIPHAGSSNWGADFLPELNGDELLALIVFLLAVLVALAASVFIVFSAPTLLGEVFLDAVVIAGLRRKMVRVAEQHWTLGAIRRTIIPFLIVALVFSLAGGIIQQVRPEANSIGGILRAERVER